jgi:hypothetical protein
LIVLIVVILGAGLGAWYRSIPEPAPRPTPTPLPPTATPQAITAKLYETIDREAQALADGDFTTFLELHVHEDEFRANQARETFQTWGRPTDGRSLYSIIDFNLRTVTNAWANIRQFRNGRSFRETHFYVWDNDRWLRDDPDPFFWNGEVETLDTPHLHVIYAAEDRELVPVVTDQLEELYTSICASLNCAAATPPLTYTVNMNNYQPVGSISEDGQTLSLLSPRVMGVYEGTWPPYLQGDLLPELMSWVIAQRIAYGRPVDSSFPAPDGRIMAITIGAWADSRVNKWATAEELRVNSIKSNLQLLLPLESLWKSGSDETSQKTYEEAFAVVYFSEQQYGETAVPNVLKNLGQAQSFADLIENSLGVSSAEFDQKWQAWMKQ